MQKPHLISFDLCPYVQRAVMTLQLKKVDYDITYISLENKPEWFLKISPFGKVPVLEVGGEAVFESAVINEFVNEVYSGNTMLPTNAVQRAKCRAWIEFGSQLLGHQYRWANATTLADAQTHQQALTETLAKLESILPESRYFTGEEVSLVETSYAPFFLRLNELKEMTGQDVLASYPKTTRWSNAILALPETLSSVPEGFTEKYRARLQSKGSAVAAA